MDCSPVGSLTDLYKHPCSTTSKKTLWASADKLRANMDAAEYKHLVLGLIFVKYISDAFVARQAELKLRLRDPADELFYGAAADEDMRVSTHVSFQLFILHLFLRCPRTHRACPAMAQKIRLGCEALAVCFAQA